MRPSQLLCMLEENFSSPAVMHRKGAVLSTDDCQTVCEVYQQWLLLATDLGYLCPESFLRTGRRLWTDMCRVDVLVLNNAFTECLSSVRRQCFKGFKALCGRVSSHLYPLVKDDVSACSAGDAFAAKRLVQLFSYTSRLSLKDIDLTQELLESYLSVEEGIPEQFDESLVLSLNKIIRRWIGSYEPADLCPRHGPGGIAERGRCSLQTKYTLLGSDQRLQYAFGNPWWVHGSPTQSFERVSRTIFVPKSYKTFRTISMEPATLQYFQQSIWRAIDRHVRRTPYLRSRIDFHDQTRNQQLAREGSLCRTFATIDLQAASDSVSYALIKEVFRGTWLPRFFLATRSSHTTLPDGRSIALKKFAPMGSALCFPVETLLFAAICEHVARGHRRQRAYSVYGDDIIVPTAMAGDVIRTLHALGFSVNTDKSFIEDTCWFRESCGGEYCDGHDVTPMRVSRKYASRSSMIRLTELTSLANEAYKRNFRYLRRFFLQKIKKYSYTPLFAPTAILADNYTNYHAKKRWNSSLHRIEVRVSQIVTRNSTPKANLELHETLRYRHWLESTFERSSLGMGFQAMIDKSTVLLSQSWVCKPYELPDQQFIDDSRLAQNPVP